MRLTQTTRTVINPKAICLATLFVLGLLPNLSRAQTDANQSSMGSAKATEESMNTATSSAAMKSANSSTSVKSAKKSLSKKTKIQKAKLVTTNKKITSEQVNSNAPSNKVVASKSSSAATMVVATPGSANAPVSSANNVATTSKNVATTSTAMTISPAYSTSTSGTSGTSTLKKLELPKPAEVASPFSISLEVERDTALNATPDNRDSEVLETVLTLGYKFQNGMKLSTKVVYDEMLDRTQTEKNSFANTAVVLNHLVDWKSKIGTIHPGVRLVLPTKKGAVEVNRMYAGVGPGLTFESSPDTFGKYFDFKYSIYGAQYFYQDTVAVSKKAGEPGADLNQYELRQVLLPTITIGKAYLSLFFLHQNLWTFQNSAGGIFQYAEELGWNFNDNFSLALTFSNSSSLFNDDGVLATQLSDDKTSVYGAKVGLSF